MFVGSKLNTFHLRRMHNSGGLLYLINETLGIFLNFHTRKHRRVKLHELSTLVASEDVAKEEPYSN